MAKSPGHREHPEHRILERHVHERIEARAAGVLLAGSTDVIKVEEDRHPARYYFPRVDVHMDRLEPSGRTTTCPFKGTAHYFHVHAGGQKLEDAAWSYDAPYDEHRALEGRLAFYDDKFREIDVQPKA